MWSIDRTEQIAEWIKNLDEDAKEAIFKSLLILREIGPLLSKTHRVPLANALFDKHSDKWRKKK
jgi:hypothetical protein